MRNIVSNISRLVCVPPGSCGDPSYLAVLQQLPCQVIQDSDASFWWDQTMWLRTTRNAGRREETSAATTSQSLTEKISTWSEGDDIGAQLWSWLWWWSWLWQLNLSFSETNHFTVKTQHTANQKKYLFAYEHEVDNHNAKVIMVMVLMTNQPNWKQAMLPVHKLRHPAGQRLQHHWRPPGWGATRKMLLVMIMLETMKNDNDDVVSIKIYKATSFKAWGVRQLLGDGGRRREPVQVLAQHHHGGGSVELHLRGHRAGYPAPRTDRGGSVLPHYCPTFKGLFSDTPWHPPYLTLPTILCSQTLATLVMKRKSEALPSFSSIPSPSTFFNETPKPEW